MFQDMVQIAKIAEQGWSSKMGKWLPSIPYPPPRDGYWSPVTSTLNWCEEDYYATHYIAELVNSLTNLEFIYLGLKGLRRAIKNGDDPVFLLAWSSYVVLGMGSFAFHATLRYSMQLVDELAMIYTTSILLHAAFSYGKSTAFQVGLGLVVAGLSIFVTAYYHYLRDPVFHQTLFAIMTIAVVIRSRYISVSTLRTSSKKRLDEGVKTRRGDAEQAQKDARDAVLLQRTFAVVRSGLAAVLIGFFIWNMDTIYCSLWRSWRHEIGLPWGLLLEGHGWWHIFTGVSGYSNVLWSSWNRRCQQGRQGEYELIWPSWFIMPEIVHHDEKKQQTTKKRD